MNILNELNAFEFLREISKYNVLIELLAMKCFKIFTCSQRGYLKQSFETGSTNDYILHHIS